MNTENGALSVTPDNPLLEFFYRTVRNIPQERFEKIFVGAWQMSQLITLRLLFYIRWCRGGKGEKQIFRWGLRKLVEVGHGETVVKNLVRIPQFGSWKDLLYLIDTSIGDRVIEFYCAQIEKDLEALKNPKSGVSLAGKWMPSQQKSMDRSGRAANRFRKALKLSFKEYRQTCTALRARISLVETKLCDGAFNEINYASVPSCARLKYANAFKKRDPERYQAYLTQVANGEKKMHVGQVFPYQLVEGYVPVVGTNRERMDDETANTMWTEIVRTTRESLVKSGANLQALGVADVSGSMAGVPLANSVALSLLWAELCEGPFKGHFYTFSSRPTLVKISGKTLEDKVSNVMKKVYVESTNVQALFEDLLTHAKLWNVPKDQYPKTIYMFTDGQFDSMTTNSDETNFAAIRRKHAEVGYPLPQIVFWNLRGDTVDFPVSANEEEVALVSGFSQSMMKLFLQGGKIDPISVMMKAISGAEFEKITI